MKLHYVPLRMGADESRRLPRFLYPGPSPPPRPISSPRMLSGSPNWQACSAPTGSTRWRLSARAGARREVASGISTTPVRAPWRHGAPRVVWISRAGSAGSETGTGRHSQCCTRPRKADALLRHTVSIAVGGRRVALSGLPVDCVAEVAGDLSQGGCLAGCGDLRREFTGMAPAIEEGGEARPGPLGNARHQIGDGVRVSAVYLPKLIA